VRRGAVPFVSKVSALGAADGVGNFRFDDPREIETNRPLRLRRPGKSAEPFEGDLWAIDAVWACQCSLHANRSFGVADPGASVGPSGRVPRG
jgi:hypothetical protein